MGAGRRAYAPPAPRCRASGSRRPGCSAPRSTWAATACGVLKQAPRGDSASSSGGAAVRGRQWEPQGGRGRCERGLARRICLHTRRETARRACSLSARSKSPMPRAQAPSDVCSTPRLMKAMRHVGSVAMARLQRNANQKQALRENSVRVAAALFALRHRKKAGHHSTCASEVSGEDQVPRILVLNAILTSSPRARGASC